MKTILTNQKNNLEKLSKVLGIGALNSLGVKANGQWITVYSSSDKIVKNGNGLLPVHNCFLKPSTFHFLSS